MTQLDTTPAITWAGLRAAANHAAQSRGEWAGAPLPVDGIPLVIEPRYPFQGLNGLYGGPHIDHGREHGSPEPNFDAGITVRNRWKPWRSRETVYVCESDGKIYGVRLPDLDAWHMGRMILDTLGVAHVWDLDAEVTAMQTLGGMVAKHTFQHYVTTGTFIESSSRSRAVYIFRRLRPTLVYLPSGDNLALSCALCLHPIGYYQGTFGGVMVPTDDVIAHLCMMRGDEHLFWRKCNQHPPDAVQAGL